MDSPNSYLTPSTDRPLAASVHVHSSSSAAPAIGSPPLWLSAADPAPATATAADHETSPNAIRRDGHAAQGSLPLSPCRSPDGPDPAAAGGGITVAAAASLVGMHSGTDAAAPAPSRPTLPTLSTLPGLPLRQCSVTVSSSLASPSEVSHQRCYLFVRSSARLLICSVSPPRWLVLFRSALLCAAGCAVARQQPTAEEDDADELERERQEIERVHRKAREMEQATGKINRYCTVLYCTVLYCTVLCAVRC